MSPIKRPWLGAALSLSVSALIIGLAQGCRHPEKEPEKASVNAEATGAEACDQFVTQLCARTGDNSQFCTSGKNLGKVLPASACQAAIKEFAQVEKQIDTDRKVCTDLMERLCKDIGPDTDSCRMVRDQTPKFPREQCQELTTNYDQVLAELKQNEAQNQPLSSETQAKIANGGVPSFGPENAKVTIVEFSDFQCPYLSLIHI